jgi:hypothetical protein
MRKNILFVVLLLFSRLIPAQEITDYLPQPDFMPDWTFDLEPQIYTKENLYEYINGEAELYNSYTFETMVTAVYVSKQNDSHTQSVDIYDMGTPLDAFGVYSNFRNPDAQYGDIGAQAIISEYNIRFYQGRFYVNLNAGVNNKVMQETMQTMAREIADKIPAPGSPAELEVLPKLNRVENSMKFVRKGFLGQSAFANSLYALYTVNSGTVTGFVVIKENAGQADKALQTFKEFIQLRGEMLDEVARGFSAVLPYQGEIMIGHKQEYLYGVTDYEQSKAAKQLLSDIEQQIRSDYP